ncbi:3'-5' exonuclease [Paenibacillus sp. UMB4589-SE434]|uniref:3'-5' exonuclease n=1 Tax=Paenibacillus sp. UMB4589-SE434 TaxID=3046314 RepID=UPI00254FE16D|nr:3'-5' exonuclease [Paenibacillus sp. UMB4589-SE434]
MLAIIYDLEMTVTRRRGQPSEIIEIGAVKVAIEEDKPVIVDTFQSFVRPVLSPQLTKDTVSFTGITQQDVHSAETLQNVLDQFIAWIDTDDYALCSWGEDDKVQFVKECRHKEISLYWLLNHTNLQKQVSTLMGRGHNQQIGLKPALESLEIAFVGSHHRALDDAYNTALIYMHYADRIEFHLNKTDDQASYESELIYQDQAADDDQADNPFLALSKLNLS